MLDADNNTILNWQHNLIASVSKFDTVTLSASLQLISKEYGNKNQTTI